MPQKSYTDNLLEGILNELQILIQDLEASQKALKESAKKGSKDSGGGKTEVNVLVDGAGDTIAMLSGLGVLGDEKTSKNIVEILSSLAAIDEKKLEKSMNALNKLAASLNNIKINKDTTNGLKAITGVFTVFKDIKVTTIMSLWMASKVMKPKTGKAISGFLIALFDPLAKKNYDSKLIKGVADLMDAIGKMVLKLSIAIGILALIAALDIKNLLIATGIVVGIVITLLTITQLIAILPAKMLAKGLDGLDHIAKCVLYLSVAIGLLALLVTIFDVETIMVGTGIVMGIVTSLLLLVTKLASKDKKTLAAGGEVIEQISSLLFKMVIAIGIIALLIKIFDMSTIIVGTLIVMGIFTVLVFGVYKLAGVDEKQLKSASKLVKSMTLMLLVVSLLALFVFVPISAQSKEVLLGAAIVLGVITIMGLIAIGLVWAIEKVGGEKGVSDICKVLMTLTIIITVVSLLALFVFPGIAKQSGDVIIGGLIVLGVVTLLSGIALLVYWAVQAIGGETGVKDICILLGTLTGVVTVISIIALFVFPGIAQKAGDVIIGGLVALGIVTVLSAIALGVYYFTLKIGGEKGVKDLCILMGVMVLVLLAVSLIAMFILVPLGAVWGDAALGAIVVMGIMAILGWMANELIKMQEKVGGQREFLKMLEIGAIMILFMLAIAYIVDKILIPIGKQWGPAAAGAIVVMGVMAILGWMADQLIDILDKVKSQQEILKMFEIAGIIILAMWAIAEITEKILVPIGKEGKAATVGGLVVTGVMELLLLMADQLVKIQKKVKSLSEVLKMLEIMTLMIGILWAVSEITLEILVPIGKRGGDAAIGGTIVLGVIGTLELLAAGLKRIQENIDQEDILKMTEIMALMTALLYVISEITLNILTPIGAEGGAGAIGGTIVVAIIGALEVVAYTLSKIASNVTPKDMIKAAAILAEVIVALWAVSEITLEIIIPIGEKGKEATEGATIVGLLLVGMIAIVTSVALLTKIMSLSDIAKGALVVVALGGIFWVLGELMEPFIELAVYTGQNGKEATKGAVILGILLGSLLVIVTAIGALCMIPPMMMILAMGALVVAGLGLIFLELAVTMRPFIELSIYTGKHKQEVVKGALILGELLGALLAVVTVIGSICIIPIMPLIMAMGMAVVAGLGLIFLELGNTMPPFIDLAIYTGKYKQEVIKGAEVLAELLGGLLAVVTAIGFFIVATLGFGGVILASGIMVVAGLGLIFLELGNTMPPFIDIAIYTGKYKQEVVKGADVLIDLLERFQGMARSIGTFVVCTLGFGAGILISGAEIIKDLGGVMLALGKTMPPFIDVAIRAGKEGKAINVGADAIIDVITRFKELAQSLGHMIKIPFFTDNSLEDGIDILYDLARVIKAVSKSMAEYFLMLKAADGVNLKKYKASDIVDIITGWKNIATGVGDIMNTKGAMSGIYQGENVIRALDPFMRAMAITMQAFADTLEAFGMVDIGAARTLTQWISGKGGFCDSVNKMLDAMERIASITPDKIRKIKDGLQPLFETLKNFFDIIELYSSMKYPVKWNEKGEAIDYKKMTDSMFISAAFSISNSFSLFLTKLGEALGPFPDHAIIAIMLMKDSFEPLMNSVKTFVDAIIMMSTAQLPIKWNEKGEAIDYMPLDPAQMLLAADNIANCFGIFLDTMGPHFEAMTPKSLSVIQSMKDGIEPLLNAVHTYSDAILAYIKGYDVETVGADGKTIKQHVDIAAQDYLDAGKTITAAFTGFLTEVLKFTDPEHEKIFGGYVTEKFERVVQDKVGGFLGIGKDTVNRTVTETREVWSATGKIKKLLDSLGSIGVVIDALTPLANAIINSIKGFKATGLTNSEILDMANNIGKSMVTLIGGMMKNDDVLNEDKMNKLNKVVKKISSPNDNTSLLNAFVRITTQMSTILRAGETIRQAVDIIKSFGKWLSSKETIDDFTTAKDVIDNTMMPLMKSFSKILTFFANGVLTESHSTVQEKKDSGLGGMFGGGSYYENVTVETKTTVDIPKALSNGFSIIRMINEFYLAILKYQSIQNSDININIISQLATNMMMSYESIEASTINFMNQYREVTGGFDANVKQAYVKPINEAASANRNLANTFKNLDQTLYKQDKQRRQMMLEFANVVSTAADKITMLTTSIQTLGNNDSILDRIGNKIQELKQRTQELRESMDGVVTNGTNLGGNETSEETIKNALRALLLKKSGNNYTFE